MKIVDDATRKEKKIGNNAIYFNDGIEEMLGLDIEFILDELIELFGGVKSSVVGQLGEFSLSDKKLFPSIVSENLNLITSLILDHKKNLTRVISDGVTSGKTITAMRQEIQTQLNISKVRAETIAITETSKANSKFALDRLDQLNVKNAIWSSAKDKRVRLCHVARGGNKYALNKGCYASCDGKFIQAGFEIRCRCAMVIYL